MKGPTNKSRRTDGWWGRDVRVHQTTICAPDDNVGLVLPNERSLQTKRDAQTGGGRGTGGYTRRQFVHQTTILGQYCRMKGPYKQREMHRREVMEGWEGTPDDNLYT